MNNWGRRGLLWPLLLSGLGLVWLAHALGALPPDWPHRLARIWPVLLVVAGLDMLLGRHQPRRAVAVVALGAVLAALALFWATFAARP